MLTIPTLCVVSLISVNFKDIQKVIGLIGGFTVVILSFIFPTLVYVKTNDYSRYHWKNVTSMMLMLFTVSFGFTAGGKAFVGLFMTDKVVPPTPA